MRSDAVRRMVLLCLVSCAACDPDPPAGTSNAPSTDAGTTTPIVPGADASASANPDASADSSISYGQHPGTAQVFLVFPFSGARPDWGAHFVSVDSPAERVIPRPIGGCTEYGSSDANPTPPVFVSAGALEVSGGDLGFSRTLPATAGPYRESFTGFVGSKNYFSGGETIRFKATGATVPAFDLTAMFPLVLLLDLPPPPEATSLVLPRNEDVTLRWQRGTPGVYLYFLAFAREPKQQSFSCIFPSAPGQVTIPRRLIEGLGTDVSADLGTAKLEHTTVGPFAIETAILTSVHYAADKKVVRAIQFR